MTEGPNDSNALAENRPMLSSIAADGAAAGRCTPKVRLKHALLLEEAPLHPAHREETLKTRVLPHADLRIT